MESRGTADTRGFGLLVEEGPPPDLGEPVLDRSIPSDVALVTPMVIRTLELLRKESLVREEEENKVGVCLEEALRNSVVHGNGSDFRKTVRLRVFRSETELTLVVSDEGRGFDPRCLRSPIEPETLWEESGRGLYLIQHYMDRVTLFDGGSTIAMARSR